MNGRACPRALREKGVEVVSGLAGTGKREFGFLLFCGEKESPGRVDRGLAKTALWLSGR